MKWFLRLSPPVRLALLAAGLVVALLALSRVANVFRGSDPASLESSSEVPASPAVDPQGVVSPDVAVGPSALDALGAPDDPLPAALPLQAIAEPSESRQAAETLAQQVLAGSPKSLPALITALQASGIGIIGPGNSVDAKPAEPWQGMTMQRWEVRTSAVMVLPERTVTFTLGDVAAFLVAVIPQLQGAPVEQLIVKDLRALAESPVPTKRFFGQFIAALGRNASSHLPYDLLGDVDPQTIRVDGLQASLIFRRLSTDVLMLTADSKGQSNTTDKKAAFFDTLREWISPTVHAQGQQPCRISESTQTIMDVAAFGTSMVFGGFEVGEIGMPGVMQRLGLSKLGGAAAYAATLLAYAQFIATYAALEAEVTLDAPPLVRTKKRSPQTGERRQLTAIVKMNLGNAQMLNCFRAMLIAVGLDFSLGNDGPVKGARVLWYGVEGFDQAAAALHGGGEAIVQFVAPEASRVQGSGSASTSPVTEAVTGEDGKVHIGVEGRGQHEDISADATRVNKSAKVRLQVALKGADLFGDLQEAAGTAAGGLIGLASLPLSVLTRAQWASTGHYRFPVIDWRDGPAEWSGTISVVETAITGSSGTSPFNRGATSSQDSETSKVTVQLTETLDEHSGGTAYASVKGKAEASYNQQKTHASWTLESCGSVSGRKMNNTSRESSNGSGTGDAAVAVSISEDGTYQISANVTRITFPIEGRWAGELEVFRQACAVAVRADARDHVPTERSLGGLIQVAGRVDPTNPDLLTGSISEEIPYGYLSPGVTARRVKTTTWQLRRN